MNGRPKIAIGIFKKRIQTRNTRIQELTLELLEAATNSCGLPLITQVSTRDFIQILDSMIKDKSVNLTFP